MKIETTDRGFVIARFDDGNGEACSLQKSSAAERDMIWLGVDDPNPQLFPGDGTGWHPYPLPENVQCSTRMHLTRERVAELLPLLQGFVETGELVESPPKSGTFWTEEPVAWCREWEGDDSDLGKLIFVESAEYRDEPLDRWTPLYAQIVHKPNSPEHGRPIPRHVPGSMVVPEPPSEKP